MVRITPFQSCYICFRRRASVQTFLKLYFKWRSSDQCYIPWTGCLGSVWKHFFLIRRGLISQGVTNVLDEEQEPMWTSKLKIALREMKCYCCFPYLSLLHLLLRGLGSQNLTLVGREDYMERSHIFGNHWQCFPSQQQECKLSSYGRFRNKLWLTNKDCCPARLLLILWAR
jgi:hypothetical protein